MHVSLIFDRVDCQISEGRHAETEQHDTKSQGKRNALLKNFGGNVKTKHKARKQMQRT
jgi:hypothetical protein